jgi:hypothetical protein
MVPERLFHEAGSPARGRIRPDSARQRSIWPEGAMGAGKSAYGAGRASARSQPGAGLTEIEDRWREEN